MAAKKDDEAGRSIVLRRLVDAPRELVWEAWTDPRRLAQWFGPNGIRTTTRSLTAKAGGSWDFDMLAPDGTLYPNFHAYREMVRPERIVADVGSSPGGPVEFRSVVTFQDVGGRTLITMRSVFPTAAALKAVCERVNAVEGGKQTLARLAEHLGKPPAWQLEIERVVSAPPARVWEAWTNPDQMKRWFAPRPFQLVVNRMDLRPGGRFEMAMRGPDGADFPFTGVYRIVEPAERLCWSGEFREGPADQMTTLVVFEDLGGRTRVQALQTFHVMTETIRMATGGAQQGWTMTLNQLEEFVAE